MLESSYYIEEISTKINASSILMLSKVSGPGVMNSYSSRPARLHNIAMDSLTESMSRLLDPGLSEGL